MDGLPQTLSLAQEVRNALRAAPEDFFDHMYGDKPDQWTESSTATTGCASSSMS